MRLLCLVFGPPGSGKTTLASVLSESEDFKQIISQKWRNPACGDPIPRPEVKLFTVDDFQEGPGDKSSLSGLGHSEPIQGVSEQQHGCDPPADSCFTRPMFNAEMWRNTKETVYQQVEGLMKRWPVTDFVADGCHGQNPSLSSLSLCILVDDVFEFPSMRKKYFSLARNYGWTFHQSQIGLPLQTCLRRNGQRGPARAIPEEVVARAHSRLLSISSPDPVTEVQDHRRSPWERSNGVSPLELDGELPVGTLVKAICVSVKNLERWDYSDSSRPASSPATAGEWAPEGNRPPDILEGTDLKMRAVVSELANIVFVNVAGSTMRRERLAKHWAMAKRAALQEFRKDLSLVCSGSVEMTPDVVDEMERHCLQAFRVRCEQLAHEQISDV